MSVTPLPPVDTSPHALAKLTATLAATAGYYDRTAEFPWEPIQAVHDAGILRLGSARTTAAVTCPRPNWHASCRPSGTATRRSRY